MKWFKRNPEKQAERDELKKLERDAYAKELGKVKAKRYVERKAEVIAKAKERARRHGSGGFGKALKGGANFLAEGQKSAPADFWGFGTPARKGKKKRGKRQDLFGELF